MPHPSLQSQVEELCAAFPGTAGVAARHLGSGEEISVHDRVSFPTASMIKIVVLFELARACARGQAQMWERVTLRDQDRTLGSGLLRDMDAGASLTLRDLAVLMMGISDNTATNILIARLGIQAINQACRDAGMFATELRNPIDFDLIRESNDNLAVTVPGDFRAFLTALRREELLPDPFVEQILGIMRIQKHTGFPLARLLPYDPYAFEFGKPQDLWVASKTGGLLGVRCEAGIVHTAAAEWAVCVMAKGFTAPPAAADNPGTELISRVSRLLYDAWGGG